MRTMIFCIHYFQRWLHPPRAHAVGEEHSITFCNVVVLDKLIPSMIDEDMDPQFHQPNSPCVPNRATEYDFMREIANDVLTERLWDLERATRITDGCTHEAAAEPALW